MQRLPVWPEEHHLVAMVRNGSLLPSSASVSVLGSSQAALRDLGLMEMGGSCSQPHGKNSGEDDASSREVVTQSRLFWGGSCMHLIFHFSLLRVTTRRLQCAASLFTSVFSPGGNSNIDMLPTKDEQDQVHEVPHGHEIAFQKFFFILLTF